jgi:hypothetical protein
MAPDKWGSITVTSLRLADGADLTPAMRFEHPDDQNADDQTVVRVPLPHAVPPGGTVTLDIDFTAQLPQVFARSGYFGDYFLVGQWFPKIAVYEPAGMRGRKTGGWNCHQYHAFSEFYADFGHFLVDITVPRAFVVGATGRRVATRQNADGTTTYTYEQDDVHDFGWTADPKFVEVHDTFSATRDVTPAEYADTAQLLGRSIDDVRLSDVAITMLMQPDHLPQTARLMRAAKAALKDFGLWYGRYPYATLTVVDPAPGASGSGGMEYPTFVTGDTSTQFNHLPFDTVRLPDMTVIHEICHQWWYGMVASNEFEEAWLDEGVNSYSTQHVLAREYGRDTSMGTFLGVGLTDLDLARFENAATKSADHIRQPAWTYANEDSYDVNSYLKPELVLETLDRTLGAPTMARVMRAYAERWRFRHPSSDDFYAVASDVAGRDLSGYFKQTVESPGRLDYEVASISATRGAAADGAYVSTVVVTRHGDVVMPVDLEITFAHRSPERVSWSGQEPSKTFSFQRPEPVDSARLDPDHHLVLDVNFLNNARRARPDRRVTAKWTSTWFFWIQNLLAYAIS